MPVILQLDLSKTIFAKNKTRVLGLATGSSVLLTYETLIKKHQESTLSFQNITTFNLDEYVGPKALPHSKLSLLYETKTI